MGTTRLASSGRVCRVTRCPLILLCVALVYISVLALRHDEKHILRGYSKAEEDEEDEEALEARNAVVEEWGSDTDRNFRLSLAETGRGPLKGGVEVYPLQTARRIRKAQVPLEPEVEVIEGVPTAWKMPERYHEGGGHALKGLYVMFHGCNHNHMDWFNLPEERTIVEYLVRIGYAVIAPDSMNDESKCWKTHGDREDVTPVTAMLWKWYRDWSIPPETPLFLFGASSGGNMATFMGSKGGFQLCEKRTTYVQVSGIISQVSWGVTPDTYGRDCPPIAFMPMPKGERDTPVDPVDRAPNVFGNSRKIPPRITAIAHHVRKAGGKPRMLLLPLGELSIYQAFFSDRVYEITEEQSSRLHSALVAARAINCNPARILDGEPECFLSADPRMRPLLLETLATSYEEISSGEMDESSNTEGDMRSSNDKQALSPGETVVVLNEGEPNNADPSRRTLTREHAKEIFRELLNVAWAEHELSADFVALWESWLWHSCGYQCNPDL